MKEKVVEVTVYTGDIYEGALVQSDPEKILIKDSLTGTRVRIYNNVIVSVQSLGWQEIEVGV